MVRVVATGRWLYGGVTPLAVRVVEVDYDFWFDVGRADDDLDEGEQPALNSDGHLYYLRYRPGWNPGMPFWPDSQGFMSLEQAQRAAEAQLPTVVDWA